MFQSCGLAPLSAGARLILRVLASAWGGKNIPREEKEEDPFSCSLLGPFLGEPDQETRGGVGAG